MIATTTVIVTVATSFLGILATYLVIWFGVPKSLRLQDATQSVTTFHRQLPLILFNIAVMNAGTWLALGQVESRFVLDTPWWIVALNVLFIFMVEDTWVYGWHRAMHEVKFLYRKVHRIHHQAYAPLPVHYLYVHPLEWMVGSLGAALGLLLVALFHGHACAYTLWTFSVMRQLHEMNVHSGMRSVITRFIPFAGRTDSHDYHHRYPTKGNYESTFFFWDRVLKTAAK
ncbi:MAG TPA: sterol desaturase family protein [Polyangium sp.]|nr:sterol desaturase family protein [Polyangium sp.]